MGNGACPKCGAPRNNGPECLQCGVIYAKAEQQAYHEKRQQKGGSEQGRKQQQAVNLSSLRRPSDEFAIDCTACKLEGGMEKKTIPRFPLFIRLIGLVFATPSAVGMLAGALMILKPGPGFGMDAPSLFWPGFFIIMLSASGGLIGWLLLMRKKAFVCCRCGFLLDRA